MDQGCTDQSLLLLCQLNTGDSKQVFTINDQYSIIWTFIILDVSTGSSGPAERTWSSSENPLDVSDVKDGIRLFLCDFWQRTWNQLISDFSFKFYKLFYFIGNQMSSVKVSWVRNISTITSTDELVFSPEPRINLIKFCCGSRKKRQNQEGLFIYFF